MYPPGQQMTVRDGGIGPASASSKLPLVVGYATGGAANKLYVFTNPNTARDTLLSGPALELAAPIAARGGVMVLVTAATTAGSCGTVTKSPVSTSTGTITVAGVPANIWKVRIKITLTGTTGTGKFMYSLDGYSNTDANTWSPEYTIPQAGTFPIPGTALTLTFVPGAGPIIFEAGDTHRFDCIAPHYTTADLTAAFQALPDQLGTRRVRRVLMAGIGQTATAQAVLWAALAGHLDVLALNWSFARAVIDGGSVDTLSAFKTAKAAFTDDRVLVVWGRASIVSEVPIPGCGTLELPASNAVAERASYSDLSENLGRFLSGPLRGVTRITHNERFLVSFTDADRIGTLKTHDGEGGFFVTNGYISSSPSSDFKFFDWGLVLDEISETVHDALNQWTLESLDAKTDGTGQLDDADAERVQSSVQIPLHARIMDPPNKSGTKGHCSDVTFTVDKTTDFLTTGEIYGYVLAVPRRPVEDMITQVGFVRRLASAS